jgi:hypothetical protein
MDVETAFLNGTLKEEIYIVPPEGWPVEQGNVLKLNKALYGLKQSAREWNENLNAFLLSKGFRRSQVDSCIYTRRTDRGTVLIAVYVDDLLIAGDNIRLIEDVKNLFKQQYKMQDMGPMEFVLGTEVTQNLEAKTIKLSQHRYTEDMLKKFEMWDVKPKPTPMQPNSLLTKSQCPTTDEERTAMESIPYREAVGSLLWLANGTRPDIAYAVGQCARFLSNPGKAHWDAVKHIMRYLKGTISIGITYDGKKEIITYGFTKGDLPIVNGKLNPQIFADADYANDPDSRRSITGYTYLLAGAPISWQSRQQKSVALSTMEAEYMAACAATQEAMWLRMLLRDLGVGADEPMVLNEDNESCIAFSKGPADHRRSKHIDIRYHFVNEKIAEKEIVMKHVGTAIQIADMLTKSLPIVRFLELRKLLLGV